MKQHTINYLKRYKAIELRNWALIIAGSILMFFGVLFIAIAFASVTTTHWWAIILAMSGMTTVYFAYKALKENEPAWIFLDLILPN